MKKILFILNGSIACYKACEAVAKLRREYQVQCVMTDSARKFIGTATLEALTGLPVLTNTFEPGKALHHIDEVRKADAIVIAPATANFINKIANGIADDLASTMMLAQDFTKPVIIAPAMNTQMWLHPATKKSLKKLQKWGFKMVEPKEGVLACGEEGTGKLASPQDIVNAVKKSLNPTSNLRVLITSGGTSEPIDDVRVLTNKSTGRTGAQIADYFSEQGAEVIYLGAKMGFKPSVDCQVILFSSFKDLSDKMEDILTTQKIDIVIHSAAVSDFTVKPFSGKMSSDATPQLEFTKNPKIVDQVKKWNSKVKLVAFKLTSKSTAEEQKNAVKKLLSHADAEWVVANDLSKINATNHPGIIFDTSMKEVVAIESKKDLAKKLWDLVTKKGA